MKQELINLLQNYKIAGMDLILSRINNDEMLKKTDIDIIESGVKSSGHKDIDAELTKVMLLINTYISRKLVIPLETELEAEIPKKRRNMDWSDIFAYLNIDFKDIESNILKEMEKVTNFNSIGETARFIKNSKNPENRILNKLNDANIIVSILMYSNKKLISSVIDCFKDNGKVDTRCLGKAIESIPSIFMTNTTSNIPGNYELFMTNFKILSDNRLDVRNIIINKPILLISENINDLLKSLNDYGELKNAIIENCGNILVRYPYLLEKNIDLLAKFGIDIRKCKIGKGFQVLGYLDLETKLAKIKEMQYDDEVLENPENALESIRGFFITQNYNSSKEFNILSGKKAA